MLMERGREEMGDQKGGAAGKFPYFDFKGPLESTCEEPSKWANERGEGGERNAVDLERVHPHGFLRRMSETKVNKCAHLASQLTKNLIKQGLYFFSVNQKTAGLEDGLLVRSTCCSSTEPGLF